MKGFNIITGIPRSGSTLLCNILSQNPAFHAGATSPLPEIIQQMIAKFSTSPEIQGALLRDRVVTQDKLAGMIHGVIDAWYSDQDKIVFDKSRGWAFQANLLHELYDDIKIIVTVRDLRSVFGSIEKQHRKTAMFDLGANPVEKTLFARAELFLEPAGMIGQCAIGAQDVIARARDNVFVLQYEAFSVDPATKIREIYTFLGLDPFDHDFEDIENVSHEPDALWLNKFPHTGDGEVKPTDRTEWKDYLTPDIGQKIFDRYPAYNTLFGYH